MEKVSLINYIKYCLGFVKLTRESSFITQNKQSVELPKYSFNYKDLLESDINDNPKYLINLHFSLEEVPNERTLVDLMNKIEEIYNIYRNDPYNKQIFFDFGFYEIEIPFEEKIELRSDYLVEEEIKETPLRNNRYPLFSLPISIEKTYEKEGGKYEYYISPVDAEIQVNINILADILEEDHYYQIVEEIGKYETGGELSLPIKDIKVFNDIWNKIVHHLKLKNVKFNEHSFKIDEVHISIRPRANYFIAEDLQELSKLKDNDFDETSLTVLVKFDDLSKKDKIPSEGELYFPFPYNKYQLRVLEIIGNKAAIVEGPPGTGKSQTIANLLCHLAAKGNKVLFVSQKDQALKVVKDMLKKLEIKYLFGYIPDIGSTQLSEEDIKDGIATQLKSLENYLKELEYKKYNKEEEEEIAKKMAKEIEEKTELKELFNNAIEEQRRFYKLSQELENLSEYKIKISNLERFKENFSEDLLQKIREIRSNLKQLKEMIEVYKKNKKKADFDRLFSTINFRENKYSEILQKIIEDITKFGYEGSNNIKRCFYAIRLCMYLGKYVSVLPIGFIDYMSKDCFNLDITKSQRIKLIEELRDYCRYRENLQQFKELKNELNNSLDTCGLFKEDRFLKINKLISEANFNEVKEKIIQAVEKDKELNKLRNRIEYPNNDPNDPNSFSKVIKRKEKTRQELVTIYLRNIINKKIADKWNEGGALVKAIIRTLAQKLSKSKKAYKTFDILKKDPNTFLTLMDIIPIWIMELDDASRIIPLKLEIFDYVIFDEASQCNIAYAIPAMYRAKKALFVGDSEQMRDDSIIFKSNRAFDELAKKYQIPEELQIKATGERVQSILDIIYLRGCESRTLMNHYRSPKELIGFSNKYFYEPKRKKLNVINSNYLTYKDTNRIMVIHQVEVDWNKEQSDKTNYSEAEEILKFFKELKSDKQYQDKSIGILTFFNDQARLIRQLFEKEGYKEERDNYKIGIIEGIQGDEKDIIIYSFVIKDPSQKNRYIPLTGEGGDIRSDINKGRVNVAFSRARLQTHCFVSMPIEEIPDGIWIKKYLEYVRDNGEVNFCSEELKNFESKFEEDFYNFIRSNLSEEYRIQNQVESCGFRIDFVIINTKNGKKIAVECDGPTHFKDEVGEVYIEDDEERQRILESAGWEFYRIKYSDWINENNKKRILDNIKKIT